MDFVKTIANVLFCDEAYQRKFETLVSNNEEHVSALSSKNISNNMIHDLEKVGECFKRFFPKQNIDSLMYSYVEDMYMTLNTQLKTEQRKLKKHHNTFLERIIQCLLNSYKQYLFLEVNIRIRLKKQGLHKHEMVVVFNLLNRNYESIFCLQRAFQNMKKQLDIYEDEKIAIG